MDTMIELWGHVPEILKALGVIVAAASVVANLTPTRRDDRWLSKVSDVVDWLALNLNVQRTYRRGL